MPSVSKRKKITIERLAFLTQREFSVLDKKVEMVQKTMVIKDDLLNFATKDDLLNFATKDDLQMTEVKILQAFDKVIVRFDAMEKDSAAHTILHTRIDDELYSHDKRIKKIEAKI
jgi:hypothetical protein